MVAVHSPGSSFRLFTVHRVVRDAGAEVESEDSERRGRPRQRPEPDSGGTYSTCDGSRGAMCRWDYRCRSYAGHEWKGGRPSWFSTLSELVRVAPHPACLLREMSSLSFVYTWRGARARAGWPVQVGSCNAGRICVYCRWFGQRLVPSRWLVCGTYLLLFTLYQL